MSRVYKAGVTHINDFFAAESTMWTKKLIALSALLTCCNHCTPTRIQPLPFLSFIHYCRELSLKQTATHFLRGHLCAVMIAGVALGYKSIPTSVLFARRPGAYFRSTYQSLTCLILFLHLRLKCFTLPPSGADLGLLGRERVGLG